MTFELSGRNVQKWNPRRAPLHLVSNPGICVVWIYWPVWFSIVLNVPACSSTSLKYRVIDFDSCISIDFHVWKTRKEKTILLYSFILRVTEFFYSLESCKIKTLLLFFF